jgi:catechol 2,3-dioxygenase-like lactoylglutathione lyase family enzyme
MDRADAELLFTGEALALLDGLPPYRATDNVVQSVSALRDKGVSPEMTRVVLRQRRLRAQAKPKFGEFAARMFFTEDGLQQATRLDVAAHHAARFRALGTVTVGDLGCGIGGDALALAGLGITVIAVDHDESTAAIATYNLAPFDNATVEQGDAEGIDLARFDALWFDPARRSNDKRLSNPADWSPSLEWVFDVAMRVPSGIKLSPAIAHDLLPDGIEAEWVVDCGDTVECVVWTGALARPNTARSALILGNVTAELTASEPDSQVEVGDIGAYVYDPSGAVIRAQLLGSLARQLGAHTIATSIAYLSSDVLVPTPFAQSFRVIDFVPLDVRTITQYCREAGIGTLEIKKRGVDIDPATFRTKLKLKGSGSATLILTRAGEGRVAIVAERVR